MELKLTTEKLVIQPFDYKFLEEYYSEFTDEITKYQYPDSYQDIEAARQVVSEFVQEMEQGNMLELAIASLEGEFIGSIEVFGLREKTPEVGLWLKKAAHGKGYGYEALKAVLGYLDATGRYKEYIYEADVRNAASSCLVRKFPHRKGECNEMVTESGKKLMLQMYYICATPVV